MSVNPRRRKRKRKNNKKRGSALGAEPLLVFRLFLRKRPQRIARSGGLGIVETRCSRLIRCEDYKREGAVLAGRSNFARIQPAYAQKTLRLLLNNRFLFYDLSFTGNQERVNSAMPVLCIYFFARGYFFFQDNASHHIQCFYLHFIQVCFD